MNQTIPFSYIEPVFRPPSEWRSLILQVTNGCSWNRCTFCEMYTAPQKKFNFKSESKITEECEKLASSGLTPNRIFLADGDAMSLSYRRLYNILLIINRFFPDVNRISSYCLPSNLRHKSVAELKSLRRLGLSLLYVGCETGDDLILDKINKGESFESSKTALDKISSAEIKSSVMILNGLGGKKYSEQHAFNSARLMTECQPDYLSTLVVSFPLGMDRFKRNFADFVPLSQLELFKEMELFINELSLKNTIFRSDHASNYLLLKGILNKDKPHLLQQIRTAITNPAFAGLRDEWQRGL